MTSCQRVDCERTAAVFPVLLLYAPSGGAPALAEIRELTTCGHCAHKLSVENFVTDDGWAKLRAAFRRTSCVEPDRAQTRLRWQHIRESARG